MRPDHVAGRLKIRPKPGMNKSCRFSVGNDVQSIENGLEGAAISKSWLV